MSLFGDIAGQVLGNANPIMALMTKLGDLHGIDPAVFPEILTIVTSHVQSAIQARLGNNPAEGIQSLILEVSSGNLSVLMPEEQQQTMLSEISEKAGISQEDIHTVLPTLMPIITEVMKHVPSEGGLNNMVGSVMGLFHSK